MFGIPLVYEGALKVIKENHLMLHDIGLVKYHTGKDQHQRYFINIAGIGFEAMVVMRTTGKRKRAQQYGDLFLQPSVKSYLLQENLVRNSNRWSSKQSPDLPRFNIGKGDTAERDETDTRCNPDDGLLDVTVIREMGRIEIIRNLKILYDGTILSHPKVDGYRASNIRVTSEELPLCRSGRRITGPYAG